MKIVSYNVNGIRAALRKGFIDWLQAADPDVVCIQETKARPEQLDLEIFEKAGYKHYWHSAEKKGYSGVALLVKNDPDKVVVGCGIEDYDREGRLLRADYGDLSIFSVYMPSGTTGDVRQDFKMKWLSDFHQYIENLKKERPNIIISGDFNICHRPIDIHNPVANKNTSGFLPEEREWVSSFIESGFVDSFRHFNEEPHNYSWWSYRANSRARNKGWRIDYNMVSKPLEKRLKRAAILKEAEHSDHCPVLVELHS